MKLHLSDLFTKTSIAFRNNNAFVLYRKPNEKLINAQFQKTNQIISKLDFKESGFVFAPFDNTNKSVFYPISDAEIVESEFDEHLYDDNNKQINFEVAFSDRVKHIELIEKAIKKIKDSEFQKVVLSRKEIIKSSNFELINTYYSLLQKYPTAMVYCWFHPKVGLWMGATPELLCKSNNFYLNTMSLAGTQKVLENKEVIWQEKEKLEQQIVTDFICEELKSELTNIKISEPFTVKAGHLWHIRTDIVGEIRDRNSLKNCVEKLHPTPAVCGFPKEKAKEFILENENYHREYYTGFFGEINKNNHTELYVNLRCMQVTGNSIAIYVGGGITKDSVPEKEWEETVAKANTMKNVFF